MKRKIFSFLAIFIGLMLVFSSFQTGSADGLITISAKALGDHPCDNTEWHFVITQVEPDSNAPEFITVTWANGSVKNLPVNNVTGHTAHYWSVDNLDSVVISATTEIYAEWTGQFNLSHGPCNGGNPTSTPTDTQQPPTATNTNQPPTSTATNTATNTAVPPSPTNTATATDQPPTYTPTAGTPTLVTNTPTGTLEPTFTATMTQVLTTMVSTLTNTVVPPTATNTPAPQQTGAGGLELPFQFYLGGLIALIGLLGLIFRTR